MKSVNFWAGVVLVALLSISPFAFGQNIGHHQALQAVSAANLPATLLTAVFGPRGGGSTQHSNDSGWGGGGNGGGGNGCGQGGNGGWGGNGGNNGNGGWGGGGNGGNGGCGVPEGGSSLAYLAFAGLVCAGAMVYRTRSLAPKAN
ncbi:MAG: hypothetical protein ABR874_09195 [Candidatus Sulfotelmatobacter sp.]|jgi:hypothetical protein